MQAILLQAQTLLTFKVVVILKRFEKLMCNYYKKIDSFNRKYVLGAARIF